MKSAANLFHRALSLLRTERMAVGVSAVVGICTAMIAYVNFFQLPLFSKRNILIAMIIFVLSTSILFVFYKFWLIKIINILPKKKIVSFIGFSLLFAAILSTVVDFNIKPLYFFYPRQTINLEFSINNTPDTSKGVSLSYIHSDIRDIGFSELDIQGDFKIKEDEIIFFPGQHVVINWQGITGNAIFISFHSTSFNQTVDILWSGSQEQIDLNNTQSRSVTAHHTFPAPIDEGLITRIIAFPIIFLICLSLLLGFYSPIPYSFLLLSVWVVVFLVYWPGNIGTVSIAAVNDLFAGQLGNWHPVFYTLMLGAIVNIFSTATLFIVLQILAASFVLGWGFAYFDELGVNRKILWGLTFVTAILPSNLLSIIKLTNDITFSILLVAITIMTIKIVVAKGKWLEPPAHWVSLVIVCFLAMLIRYNGIPAIALTLLALLIYFPNQRKITLFSIILIITIWALVNGPLFDLMGIQKTSQGHLDNIILHHISAHVDAGTPLDPGQQAYLSTLLPLDQWKYSCCSNKPVLFQSGFDVDTLHKNSKINRKIALELILKDPAVEINHILCASDLVWNITGRCDLEHPVITAGENRYFWTDSHLPQYREDSKLPFLVNPLSELFGQVNTNRLLTTIFWRPAIYLYLSLIFTLIFYFRTKIKLVFVVLAPLLGQSIFLFLFNRTQNFRYQYCAIPICLILAGLIFIPLYRESIKE